MINKEKVRELADKYVAEEDLGNQLLMLIANVAVHTAADYYGYKSVDDYIEHDNVPDVEFSVFMDVIKESMNKAVMDALP